MSNPCDDVSGSALLRFTAPCGADKEEAGNTTRDADKGEYDVCRKQPPKGGNVLLTRAARQLRAAEETVRQAPAADMDKVERIRRRIADDSFSIDTRRVAAKLLAANTWLD